MAERNSTEREPVVCIVDDDAWVRRALARLVASVGIRSVVFASPAELLRAELAEDVACLVLDVRLPGLDGFELHERIVRSGRRLPVIFITAHNDEVTRARARRAGAIALLAKPFDDETLLAAIVTALGTDAPFPLLK